MTEPKIKQPKPPEFIPRSWANSLKSEIQDNGEVIYTIDEREIILADIENGEELKRYFIQFIRGIIHILNDFPGGRYPLGSKRYLSAAKFVGLGVMLSKPAMNVDFDYKRIGIKAAKVWKQISSGGVELRLMDEVPWGIMASTDYDTTHSSGGLTIPRIYLENKNFENLPPYCAEMIETLFNISQALEIETDDTTAAEMSIEEIGARTTIDQYLNNFKDELDPFNRRAAQGLREFTYHMNKYGQIES